MKNIILISLFIVGLNSCCKEESKILGCNLEDPLEELEWFKALYDSSEYSLDPSSSKYYNSILYKEYFDGTEYIEIKSAELNIGVMYDCTGNFICDYPYGCDTKLSSKTLRKYKTIAPI